MNSRRKKPTMKDVAQRAQVSVQTVSAVINQKPEITARTRARVLEAISEMGYQPYRIARSLRTGQTHTIALIVSDIANPPFAAMASAAEDRANDYGYSLIVYNTHDDSARETTYIEGLIQRWIDGLLFVAAQDRMESLDSLLAADVPFVAVDRVPEGYSGALIRLNHFEAGRRATEHLIRLNHQRIAHISGAMHIQVARERLDGYRKAIHDAGLQTDEHLVVEGKWDYQDGYEAMQRLLMHPPYPTAVFAASDRMAIGAMRAAYEAGLHVPEHLSVIGVDDIPVASYTIPSLTTLVQPYADMGREAVEMLIHMINGRQPEPRRVVVEPELIVRQSTAPAGQTQTKDR